MDTLQIHCPSCGVRLDVPANAGGRPARCPKCKTRFRVPDPHVMLDETVTCWLNLDQIHQDEEREDHEELESGMLSQSLSVDDEQPTTSIPTPAMDVAAPVAAPVEVKPVHQPVVEAAAVGPVPSTPKRRVIQQHSSGTVLRQVNGANHSAAAAAAPAAPAANPHRPFVPHDAQDGGMKLYVLGVGAYGVRLGFACGLLNSIAFRASMPMRGLVSGESDASRLIARPLAWVDKATGHFTNPGELEARYEVHTKLNQTTREVVEIMRPMDELPSPFNLPMPYYVGHEDAVHGSLHCETVATPHGIQCEVVIPSIRYALEWLGRVNGVCGAEYQQLENEAQKFEAGSWRSIPQHVRHRLAVWFEFQGDEQFLAYFGDSDFAKADLGLAGAVVTTHRLVWCKYHQHGAILLAEPGLLTAIERGPFADLHYRGSDGTRRKMIRLRNEDLNALADLLAGLPMALTMQIEAAGAGDDSSVIGDSGVISETDSSTASQ